MGPSRELKRLTPSNPNFPLPSTYHHQKALHGNHHPQAKTRRDKIYHVWCPRSSALQRPRLTQTFHRVPERRPLHLDPAPAGRRPPVWRAPVRALEPHSERAHGAPVRHLPAQRAQHVQPRQRGRECHVPPLEGLQGEG